MRIIIAGSGAAAVEAARHVRRHDPDSTITVFSAEKLFPYRRPLLPGLLNLPEPPEHFYIHNKEFYEQNSIEVKLGSAAIRVDPLSNELYLQDGKVEKFDRLLLAIGSRAVKIPISGSSNLLRTVHNYDDILYLKQELPNCRHVLIVGGGVLGLELADKILKMGIKVTVAERQNRLLSNFLDESSHLFLQHLLRRVEGLTLLRNCQLQSLQPDSPGINCHLRSTAVRLLKADMVIAATGTIANTVQWPDNCGIVRLETDKYLQVKNFKNIFAAGDCIFTPGQYSGIYRQAVLQGAIAGTNMLGLQREYIPPVPQLRTAFMNIKLFCAGNTADPELQCKQYVTDDSLQHLYYSPTTGKLQGCILINNLENADDFYQAISS